MNPLLPLKGFTLILLFQCIGELLSRVLHLPVPGPVIGMVLMLPALSARAIREPVEACANFLLAHLSLLFVPISVGVVTQIPLLREFGGRILLTLVVSTLLGLAVTAFLVNLWIKPPKQTFAEELESHGPAASSKEAAHE